jgi:hypothetical protein
MKLFTLAKFVWCIDLGIIVLMIFDLNTVSL